MKNLKYIFAICLLSSLFFTSCTKQNPLDQELPVTDDSALMLDLHESDALTGTGIVKEDNKFAYSVKYEDLPAEIQDQLLGKKELELANDLKISSDVAKRIWGDKIENTPLAEGFTIPKGTQTVTKKYMTPEGVDMTQAVKDDPSILADERMDILDYWYLEIGYIVNDDGSITIVYVYLEECTVIIF